VCLVINSSLQSVVLYFGLLAAALGVEVKEITKYVNSVTFCLSKGLGAPVGSVICGSVDFIKRVRRARKMTGGTFLILFFWKVEISRAIVFDSCLLFMYWMILNLI